MAAVIGQVRDLVTRPFGVDLVWDPVSSLAVARATGASFVREVFTGVFESDLGLMQPDFGAIAAYREQIGAGGVAMFTNITPEFASSLGNRSIATRARSAAYLGVDAILISGQITGTSTHIVGAARGEGGGPGHARPGQHRRTRGNGRRDSRRRRRRLRRHQPEASRASPGTRWTPSVPHGS